MEMNITEYHFTVNSIKKFISEMKDYTKAELEGIIHSIENDENVTYGERCRSGYANTIHGTETILIYTFAKNLLQQFG